MTTAISAVGLTPAVTTLNTTKKTETSTDFAAIIADALDQELKQSVVQTTGAVSGYQNQNYSALSGGGIEQMIMAAASTGEVSDAQIALFMLCTMMQSSQDSDFSQLFGLMSSMLTQITDGAGTLRDTVLAGEYDPYVLDTIDRNVFSAYIPETTGSNTAVIPTECWKPTTPAIVSTEDNRSPETLRAVIDQFNVETATRYEPFRNGYTYCNIFVWDVTSALGAEIPHYIDEATGTPRQYPDIKGAKELGAIGIENWLVKHGQNYGWREVDAETAQNYANKGKPAITTAGQIGHVQVVCPSKNGEFDPIRGAAVAQAGKIVTNYTNVSNIYSAAGQKNVRYFVHE